MTRAAVRVAAVAMTAALSWHTAVAATIDDDPNARVLRLERWLKAAVCHAPGSIDDASKEVAAWPYADLRVLRFDEAVMAKLLHTPAGAIRTASTRDAPPYTGWQVRRLRELAEAFAKQNDHDALLVRGALLHGDVAMSNPGTGAPEAGADGIRIQSLDGEAIGFNHDTTHLRLAREMFPDDATLQFLSGCQQETYAGPAVQSIAKTAVLPAGYHVDIESESAALRDAESFFRRALVLDSRLAEARLRLSHVLLAGGRPQEAGDELRKADMASEPAELRYYHAMFLGQTEVSLGHVEQARDAYARASSLFPDAQARNADELLETLFRSVFQ